MFLVLVIGPFPLFLMIRGVFSKVSMTGVGRSSETNLINSHIASAQIETDCLIDSDDFYVFSQ